MKLSEYNTMTDCIRDSDVEDYDDMLGLAADARDVGAFGLSRYVSYCFNNDTVPTKSYCQHHLDVAFSGV